MLEHKYIAQMATYSEKTITYRANRYLFTSAAGCESVNSVVNHRALRCQKKDEGDDFVKKVISQSIGGVADVVTAGACVWLIYWCIASEKYLSDLPDLSFALGGPSMAAYMVVKDLSITLAIIVLVQLIKFETTSRLN